MLQKCFELTDQLYDPINHLTQNELIEKFNLAFYKAQNLSKIDILSTFNETEDGSLSEVIEMNDGDYTNDDYLIDYLISNSPLSTPSSEVDPTFDFDDFVVDFDQSFGQTDDQTKLYNDNHEINSGKDNFYSTEKQNVTVPVPDTTNEFGISFVDIDITDELINSSLDADQFSSDIDQFEESIDIQPQNQEINSGIFPPGLVTNKKNADFNNFLRSFPAEDLGGNVSYNNITTKNEFGHLVGIKCINNNFSPCIVSEETPTANYSFEKSEDNQKILPQNEALLNDDPLLSFSNILYTPRKKEFYSKVYQSDNDDSQIEGFTTFQCRWENCYQIHDSQDNLVKHIEKYHVELKRGEEFTCFWENCPRQTKPFNARYKLLIHMRVHSGEKPNKCPFKGCNKAFSRLENLKIHQRSHTGERPYLCQFPTCTKSFSNSSDRAKHQRTHFDTKPYACQVIGCNKKYTDPSSLRKHVKNHTSEEQKQLKKKSTDNLSMLVSPPTPTTPAAALKKYFGVEQPTRPREYAGNLDHSYSSSYLSSNIKQDLKNKLYERTRQQKVY